MPLKDLMLPENIFLVRLLMLNSIESEYLNRRSLNANKYASPSGYSVLVDSWTDDDKDLIDRLKGGDLIPRNLVLKDLAIKCCQQLRLSTYVTKEILISIFGEM